LKGDIIKAWWTEVAPSTGPIFSGHQEVSSGMSITYLLGIESNLPLNTSVQPHSYSRPVDKYLQLSPIEPTIPRWLQPCCYCVFEELTVVFALRITTAADELNVRHTRTLGRRIPLFQLIYVFHDAHHYHHNVIPIFAFFQIGLNFKSIILHTWRQKV
jgi:hypothetical protein